MILVDTNVFVHTVEIDSPFHDACSAWLHTQRASGTPWFTTWPIVYEFLRVSTHVKGFRHPLDLRTAWGFVSALIDSPNLQIVGATSRHASLVAQIASEFPRLAGNIMHDVHTYAIMLEHEVRVICTRDTHFRRFPSIRTLDPVHAAQ